MSDRSLNLVSVEELVRKFPDLAGSRAEIVAGSKVIVDALKNDRFLFLAGNGGSMADSLHIAGELKKSFEKPRPLPNDLTDKIRLFDSSQQLADNLQLGVKAIVLGVDPVLTTAIDNDISLRHIHFAQELLSLGAEGDSLFLLSTSGKSQNLINAGVVAKAMGLKTVLLTGASPSEQMLKISDVTIRTPSTHTATVQHYHSVIYHSICGVIENTLFS
jgi:D-sedoheptulose 7-phosphate isomerase